MMFGNLLFLVLIAVVIYMMMKGGGCCGGHNHHGGHRGHEDHGEPEHKNNAMHAHHHTDAYAPTNNRTVTDPVCGMEVRDDKIESTHLGRTFHFCSEHCKEAFNRDPGKYAGA